MGPDSDHLQHLHRKPGVQPELDLRLAQAGQLGMRGVAAGRWMVQAMSHYNLPYGMGGEGVTDMGSQNHDLVANYARALAAAGITEETMRAPSTSTYEYSWLLLEQIKFMRETTLIVQELPEPWTGPLSPNQLPDGRFLPIYEPGQEIVRKALENRRNFFERLFLSEMGYGFGLAFAYCDEMNVMNLMGRAGISPEDFDLEQAQAVANVLRLAPESMQYISMASAVAQSVILDPDSTIPSWMAEHILQFYDQRVERGEEIPSDFYHIPGTKQMQMFRTTYPLQALSDYFLELDRSIEALEPDRDGCGYYIGGYIPPGFPMPGLTDLEKQGQTDFDPKRPSFLRNRRLTRPEVDYNVALVDAEKKSRYKKKYQNIKFHETHFFDITLPFGNMWSSEGMHSMGDGEPFAGRFFIGRYSGAERREDPKKHYIGADKPREFDQDGLYPRIEYPHGYNAKVLGHDVTTVTSSELGAQTRDGKLTFFIQEAILPVFNPGVTTPRGHTFFHMLRDACRGFTNRGMREETKGDEVVRTHLHGVAYGGPFYDERNEFGWRLILFGWAKSNGPDSRSRQIKVPCTVTFDDEEKAEVHDYIYFTRSDTEYPDENGNIRPAGVFMPSFADRSRYCPSLFREVYDQARAAASGEKFGRVGVAKVGGMYFTEDAFLNNGVLQTAFITDVIDSVDQMDIDDQTGEERVRVILSSVPRFYWSEDAPLAARGKVKPGATATFAQLYDMTIFYTHSDGYDVRWGGDLADAKRQGPPPARIFPSWRPEEFQRLVVPSDGRMVEKAVVNPQAAVRVLGLEGRPLLVEDIVSAHGERERTVRRHLETGLITEGQAREHLLVLDGAYQKLTGMTLPER